MSCVSRVSLVCPYLVSFLSSSSVIISSLCPRCVHCDRRPDPYIYIYAFSRRFYPKRLTIAFRLYIFISMCVPWESNPQPFALLTQCSTTEPHRSTVSGAHSPFVFLRHGSRHSSSHPSQWLFGIGSLQVP